MVVVCAKAADTCCFSEVMPGTTVSLSWTAAAAEGRKGLYRGRGEGEITEVSVRVKQPYHHRCRSRSTQHHQRSQLLAAVAMMEVAKLSSDCEYCVASPPSSAMLAAATLVPCSTKQAAGAGNTWQGARRQGVDRLSVAT